MNIYVMYRHQRPSLLGTTGVDVKYARSLGFDVDLILHPGGAREWAVCLGQGDDLSQVLDSILAQPEAANRMSTR
jgi:hypothetical protein